MAEKIRNEGRTFEVETRFQKMARRPGGIPREQAIERAQSKIEEVKPSFTEWLDGGINELIGLAGNAAQGAYSDASWTEGAALLSRRIRDVGTTMGFELVTFIANNLCEIFEAIGNGAEYRSELVNCHIEALLLAKQERYRALRPEQLPELSSGLRRVLECVTTVPGAKIE
jgi:hypothetical protein